MEQVIVTKIWS